MNLLAALARDAEAHGLRFLVIGGLAVNAYGYSRTTLDIDLLVERSTAESWAPLLLALGYQPLERESGPFRQWNPPISGMSPIDFMLVNEATFAGFWAAARDAEVGGARFRIPSLEHLFALKLHALKHAAAHRDARDFGDLLHLIHLHKLRVDDEAFAKLVEKYGPADALQRIRHAVQSLPSG